MELSSVIFGVYMVLMYQLLIDLMVIEVASC